MQRYFAQVIDKQVILDDGDVHHLLHVMRAQVGDQIEVVFNNHLYCATIKNCSPLCITVDYEIPTDSELPKDVTLFFALAKGDKIDFVVQKATELGVKRIVLLKTQRCVTKFDNKDIEHKLERFKKIAKEASEQSHRLVVPEIIGVVDIKNIPNELLSDKNLIAYEKEAGNTTSLYKQLEGDYESLSIFIGPEGGFSEAEIDCLTNKSNFATISLGKRILRTETAAVYALSVIGFYLEK